MTASGAPRNGNGSGAPAAGGTHRLVIDTATRQSTVGLGDGRILLAQSTRTSEHRHGSLLLDQIAEVLERGGVPRSAIAAIGVGTGPGSFTGLRVGLATAKTLAYALGVPICGIPTGAAIARAVAEAAPRSTDPGSFAVILPAGARDHYLALPDGEPRLLAPGTDLGATGADRIPVAVDLPGSDLGPAASERGERGLRGLAAAMLALLDERLAAGALDDAATLVPAYVALPRGVGPSIEGVAWSPDLR